MPFPQSLSCMPASEGILNGLDTNDLPVLDVNHVCQAHDTDIESLACETKDPRCPGCCRAMRQTNLLAAKNTPSGTSHTPPEIWTNVFQYFRDVRREDGSTSTSLPQLLQLGQVSSLWRNITLNTASLWSDLELSEDSSLTIPLLLNVWIPRSGQASVDVFLDFLATVLEDSIDKHGAVLTAISALSDRWRNASFRHIPLSYLDHFEAVKHQGFSRLEKLWLTFDPSWELAPNDMSEARLDVFTVAPKLREAIVVGYFEASRIELPWNQIEVLHWSHSTFSDDCSILAQCTQLREFTNYLPMYRRDIYEDFKPVRNNLFSLELHTAIETLAATQFLRTVTLPKLESLCLGGGIWSTVDFCSFIERSKCTLRRAQFRGPEFTEEQMVECLAGLASLETLKISSARQLTNAGAFMLASLILSPDCAWLLPGLRVFEFDGCEPASEAALIAMVESRRHQNVVALLTAYGGNRTDVVAPALAALQTVVTDVRRPSAALSSLARDITERGEMDWTVCARPF